MAHLTIGVNTETGEVIITASKKVKDSLTTAIQALEDVGYTKSAANSVLASLVPLNMAESERSSGEVEGDNEDIIFETTFESTVDILNSAIVGTVIEILSSSVDEESEESEEDSE